jgi:hypothetical protein
LKKSCKDHQTNKCKELSNQRKILVAQTILERMDSNMVKWYGHVVRIDGNRLPKRIMAWSPDEDDDDDDDLK